MLEDWQVVGEMHMYKRANFFQRIDSTLHYEVPNSTNAPNSKTYILFQSQVTYFNINNCYSIWRTNNATR